MKKTPLPPQSLSSSAIAKWSSAVPPVLLALLHISTVICTDFSFSSWTPIVWVLFLPYYILLWIASFIYVIHWRKMLKLKEKEKERQIESADRAQAAEDIQKVAQLQLEREKFHLQHSAIQSLLAHPSISQITSENNPLLGENSNIEFNNSPAKTDSHEQKKKNK